MTDAASGHRQSAIRTVLGRLALLLLLILVIASYWWLPATLRQLSFFDVRRVQVTGIRYLAADDVVRALGLRPDASVFDDLDELEARLATAAGIEQARVTRRLPATLVVEVVEVEPVALGEGPDGLIALAADAKPLPYDVVTAPVDAPIIGDADPRLLAALAEVQAADLELYRDVVGGRLRAGEMTLELAAGRIRLPVPVSRDVVRAVSLVRSDLAAQGSRWREIDGRYAKWVVVRGEGDSVATQAVRREGGQAVTRTPVRARSRVTRRPPAPRATGRRA